MTRLCSTYFVSAAIATGMLVIGCGGTAAGPDAGSDAFMGCVPFVTPTLGDAGPPPAMPPCRAPDGGTPGQGPCCYRESQAAQRDNPELRLAYIDIEAPEGSLTSTVLLGVLNDALARESFNWLFRIEGAEADGPVMIRTGFGYGPLGGPYEFPTGAMSGPFDLPEYVPVAIPGNLSGEIITSEVYDGALVVPVLNTAGTEVQLELTLRNIRVIAAEASTDRSCFGFLQGRGYATGAILDGYVEVAGARTGMVVSGPIMTTVCTAIASPNISDATYCEDNPQSMWRVQPDSLCPPTGPCMANTGCDEDVCDRGADSTSGLPACNAWRLVARFAAQGVQITN